MKIAIFSDNFYPELSGIADSIIKLATELSKLGHEICFFAPRYGAKDFRAVKLPERELDLGDKIKIKRLFSLPAAFAGAQARLVLPLFSGRLFKKFKPDIIHSQLFFGAGLEALIAARFYKLPFIGTNHTSITDFVPYAFAKKPSLKYSIWYYNRCDFVTAPSQSVFKEMLAHGFNKPHGVISNPIDINTFCLSGDKSAYKKKFGLSGNTVVYAGRLSPEKNIDVLIKAAALAKKSVSDINLAIAGSGQLEVKLKKLAKELSLENEVKFFGTLSKVDLAKLYQASEVFAIASTSETQSMVLMQALASSLPAVAVDSRALPEYVNEKNGYVVKAGDEKAMAEKFMLLLSDQKLRQDLGRGAYNFVWQFSAPNIAKNWERLYGEVIKNYKNKA
ncbi:MAG: glycosyltransferase [Patescibacteria group bacterium]|nr:glycosyltransferase [Patescibacteria group bacterium]